VGPSARGFAAEAPATPAAAARPAAAAAPAVGPPAGYREDMAWESLGVVADAYSGKKELGLTWWATGDGWRRARARLTEWGGMALALAICRRDVPGFKIGGMKEVCGELYAAVNAALAAGNTR